MKKKITIQSVWFCAYLLYAIYVCGTEIIDITCYICGFEQATFLSRIVWGGIILVVAVGYGKKYFSVQTNKINIRLILGIALIIIVGLMKTIYPDTATDTLNYHLLIQKPGFENYFQSDFANGNFQAWGFRLGDRMFYAFRQLLGYRMGTSLNTLTACLIFLQLNQLLQLVTKDVNCKKSILRKLLTCSELWSLLIIFSQQIIYMFGIYYIDILFIPLLLEALRRFVLVLNNRNVNSLEIIYFAALNGLCFAFKITNIIFVAPLVISYIIVVRKKIKISNFMCSAFVAALPCFPYLIRNTLFTGNPFFPILSSVFQTQYYTETGLKFGLSASGGVTIVEKFLWIFYLAFRPTYRQLNIQMSYTVTLKIGVISLTGISAFLILRKIRYMGKSLGDKKVILSLIGLQWIYSFLWGFSSGYPRYFIFGIMLLEMIIFYSVCQLCAIDNKFSWLSQGICIFLLCIIFLESLWTVKDTINGREWAWRKFKIDTAKEQMNVIFKDKNSKKTIEDISMFFITNTVYCGYAELIDSDTYVYNADYFTKAGIDSQDFECLYRENENLLSGTIYDIKPYSWKCTEENLYSYIDRLNEFDMVITGIEECDTVIDKVKLLQYTYNPERENEVYCAGEGETAQFIAETDGNTLSWITIPETQVEGKVSRLEIMLDYPDGTTKKICIEADGVMETFEISVGTVKKGTLIRVYSDNEYFIINPRID